MKGGTGVYIDNKNLKENFIEFLKNSHITFVGKGAFGITYKAIFKGRKSPYKNIDYSGYGTYVHSLLIKISVIEYKNPDNTENPNIRTIGQDDFVREVNIQTETFLKTMNYLQPLCPAIVYSGINENDNNILDIIKRNYIEDLHRKESKRTYVDKLINCIDTYTVIGMELLDNFETLYSIELSLTNYIPNKHGVRISNEKIKQYLNMLIYILVEFAVKLGYTHSDFHASNIMINPNETNYFDGVQGSIILIDFGLVKKIEDNILNEIKKLHNEEIRTNRYSDIIEILCNIPRIDSLNLNNYDVYKLVCGFKPNDSEIDDLFRKKQIATHKIIEIFNKETDRERFPLLPLSNSIKHRMFPGLVEIIPEPKDSVTIIINDIGENVKNSQIMISWIYIQISKILKIMEMNGKPFSKKHSIMLYVNCLYNTIYLTTASNGKSDHVSKYFLRAVAAMYYSGINKKISNNVYGFFRDITGKRYSMDDIIDICDNVSNILDNVYIVKISDFMSDSNFDDFFDYSDDRKKDLFKDIKMYTNPREWVKTQFRTSDKSTNYEPYVFPFEDEIIENFEFPLENEKFVFPFEDENDIPTTVFRLNKASRKRNGGKRKHARTYKNQTRRKYKKQTRKYRR